MKNIQHVDRSVPNPAYRPFTLLNLPEEKRHGARKQALITNNLLLPGHSNAGWWAMAQFRTNEKHSTYGQFHQVIPRFIQHDG